MYYCTEAKPEHKISLRFLGTILRVLRLEVPYTLLTIQPVSNHFAWGKGGGVKSVVEVTVNSKEENF